MSVEWCPTGQMIADYMNRVHYSNSLETILWELKKFHLLILVWFHPSWNHRSVLAQYCLNNEFVSFPPQITLTAIFTIKGSEAIHRHPWSHSFDKI